MEIISKKIPHRQCVGCRESKPKKELIRIIRTPENEIIVDVSGRKNGRGAYICPNPACLQKGKKSKGLERSLKAAIPEDVYVYLEKEMNEIVK